jgi:hypothetical protein
MKTGGRPIEKPAGQTAKTKARGRPKKEKTARPLAAQKPMGKGKGEPKASSAAEEDTTT